MRRGGQDRACAGTTRARPHHHGTYHAFLLLEAPKGTAAHRAAARCKGQRGRGITQHGTKACLAGGTPELRRGVQAAVCVEEDGEAGDLALQTPAPPPPPEPHAPAT